MSLEQKFLFSKHNKIVVCIRLYMMRKKMKICERLFVSNVFRELSILFDETITKMFRSGKLPHMTCRDIFLAFNEYIRYNKRPRMYTAYSLNI